MFLDPNGLWVGLASSRTEDLRIISEEEAEKILADAVEEFHKKAIEWTVGGN